MYIVKYKVIIYIEFYGCDLWCYIHFCNVFSFVVQMLFFCLWEESVEEQWERVLTSFFLFTVPFSIMFTLLWHVQAFPFVLV